MKRGKASGTDNLMVEHVICSHSILIVILAKLFNLIVTVTHHIFSYQAQDSALES